MRDYFPELMSSWGGVKIELNLSSYAPKADFKKATDVGTSDLAKNTDLTNLKNNKDKVVFDKLKNVPSNLNNLKRKVDKLDID